MTITLPILFAEKLDEQPQLKGPVFSAITSFDAWFTSSGTPVFFRDYTDHGPKHIESVLLTAEQMIPAAAKPIVSPADAAILILSSLLHDSAMHIAEPGFKQVIDSEWSQNLHAMDCTPWKVLWEEYLFQARRWSADRISSIIGAVAVDFQVSDPFERWGNLQLSDYKLIGEFIRWHHPRLAHEFALNGVPGVDGAFLRLPDELTSEWKDIAGIVARSHGLPLRVCTDYVAEEYHARDYQGIHAAYLMTLLRLSDYLQIQADRAPSTVFGYRVLPSRISNLEWKVHNCIKNITPQNEDPESVEITAAPPDIKTYLRVKEWLSGIQEELDVSWAVLGQIYGRFDELRNLGLHWRRVRANVDDERQFAKTVPYLPRQIRLEVARSELLSLLARPLYGDDPTFGVRELVQNACDAVRERRHFVDKNPTAEFQLRTDMSCDIVVRLEAPSSSGDPGHLEIIDSGIGMTADVLINYFFTAGASYRSSGQWQQTFQRSIESATTGTPRSMVPRTGRFGVGVLASFLIGPEVQIETRHLSAETGFRCSAKLVDDAVQVESDDSIPTGTRIKIPLNDEIFNALARSPRRVARPAMWEWNVLNDPVVERYVSTEEAKLATEFGFDLSDWVEAATDLPLTIHWAYENEAPRLSCNGIFVSDSAKIPAIEKCHVKTSVLPVTPAIHVFDPDGVLPLGLTRKDLVADSYGFESELARSIESDFMKRINSLPNSIGRSFLNELGALPHYSGNESYKRLSRFCPDLVLTAEGFAFASAAVVESLEIKQFLWLEGPSAAFSTIELLSDLSAWDAVFIQGSPRSYAQQQGGLNRMISEQFSGFNIEKLASDNVSFVSGRSTLRLKSKYEGGERKSGKLFVAEGDGTTRTCVTLEKRNNTGSVDVVEETLLTETRDLEQSRFPYTQLLKNWKRNDTTVVAEVRINTNLKSEVEDIGFGRLWNDLFGAQLIPWELGRRK